MVYCFAIVYLLLPFLIFSLSFIKLWIGIPIVILIIASLLYHQFMKANENSTVFTFSKKDLLSGLIIPGDVVHLFRNWRVRLPKLGSSFPQCFILRLDQLRLARVLFDFQS